MGTKRRTRNEDEDDEDDDRPAKRRKARSEEDEDDERPSRRRRSNKEARADVDDLDEVDDVEKPDDDEAYEQAMRELNRKKARRLAEYTALTEGLRFFEQHIRLLLLGTAVTAATYTGIFLLSLAVDYFSFLYYLAHLLAVALAIGLPVLMILGAKKCQTGPPKCARSGLLTGMIVVSLLSGAGSFLNFILLSMYLRNAARHLKDKSQAKAAHGVMLQIMYIGIGGIVVVGIAFYFLRLMGTLGYILWGAVALVYLLLILKILVETIGILGTLCNTIARAMKAEEIVEW